MDSTWQLIHCQPLHPHAVREPLFVVPGFTPTPRALILLFTICARSVTVLARSTEV